MVRKAGLVCLLFITGVLFLCSCGKRLEKQDDSPKKVQGDDTMDQLNVTETLKELLGCNTKTAESIEKQCSLVGIDDITGIEKETNDVYIILKMTAQKESVDYYVFLDKGFFLEQIRKDAKDGKRIYMAME